MGFKYDKAKHCSMWHRYNYHCNHFPPLVTQGWLLPVQKTSAGMWEQSLLFPFGCPWLAAQCLPPPPRDVSGGLCRRTPSSTPRSCFPDRLQCYPLSVGGSPGWCNIGLGAGTTSESSGYRHARTVWQWLEFADSFVSYIFTLYLLSQHQSSFYLSLSLSCCPFANLPWPHPMGLPHQPLSSPFSDTGRWHEVRPLPSKSSAFTTWHQCFQQILFPTQLLPHR